MSETKPIEHFVATLDESGQICVHVEAGEYVGDFVISDELITAAIEARASLSNERKPE